MSDQTRMWATCLQILALADRGAPIPPKDIAMAQAGVANLAEAMRQVVRRTAAPVQHLEWGR